MRQWRFEVLNRPGFSDVQGRSVLEDIRELGITSVEAVQSAKVFLIEADFDEDFAERLAKKLLTDPVCEEYYIGRSGAPAGLAKATLIEVHLKSGVTDKIKHRKLIIPGYIAAESGGLEEELKDWEIQVGPRDAANLTPFLKAWKA